MLRALARFLLGPIVRHSVEGGHFSISLGRDNETAYFFLVGAFGETYSCPVSYREACWIANNLHRLAYEAAEGIPVQDDPPEPE